MSGNFGIGQSGATCWFHSSLNTLLLSENGQKILWDKMQKVYSKFPQKDKVFFDSDINAPCPVRKDIKKTSMVYFWKFLDQYLCSHGPGRLSLYHGKNVQLLKNMNIVAGSAAKRGEKGAFATKEIDVILKHIGFTSGDYNIIDFSTALNNRKKFAIRVENKSIVKRIALHNLDLKQGNFELSGAVLFVTNNKGVGVHSSHDVSCVKRGNKGYIIDSNHPYRLWPCEWWNEDKMTQFINKSDLFNKYANFRDGKITSYGFEFLLYTNSTFTDKISPSCKRVGKPTGKPAYKQVQIMRMLENLVKKAKTRSEALNQYNLLKNSGYVNNGNKHTFIYFLNKKQFSKTPNTTVNKKGRPILKGPKGGLYVIGPKGKKIYKKLVPASGVNTKGRNVKTGERGGHYVLSKKSTKMYKFFH